MKECGAEKIAIGFEDIGYGFGGRDDITRALEAKGLEPVAKVKFSRPDTDTTAQAQIIKRSETDAVYHALSVNPTRTPTRLAKSATASAGVRFACRWL